MPFGFGRKNSEKTLNNTAAPVVAAPVAAAPLQGRSYELPAEPVAAAVLTGKTYELPMESPIIQQGSASAYVQETTYSSGAYSNVAGNRLSVTRAEPTVIETIHKDVVIQERIHPVEKEEIQPIIYREREQLDVRQVTQMMHETQIQPTLIEQRELPAERREVIVERGAPIQENIILATTERDATLRTQQIHAPIIEETIKKTIIEEIQPVLERDVFVPTVVQHTQPIYEKIVEAPTVYREVREVRELGTREVFAPVVAPVLAPVMVPVVPVVEPVIVREPASLTVVPITTTTVVETYDHKLNPIETRDFINNRGLPLR